MFNFFNKNKGITEKLYEQNLELAVKNKTLSLLQKLYHTSTLTLTPEEMAKAITDIIQHDLNLECTGIFHHQKKDDSLVPLAFSESDRLAQVLQVLGVKLEKIPLEKVSQNRFLQAVLHEQKEYVTHEISDIWAEASTNTQLQVLQKDCHVKTLLLLPLVIGKEMLGVLVLGFNRDYETLSAFEKESIKSFTNPIGLLLYKAYLYKNIQSAYAVEKKAKEELEKIDKFKDQFLMTTQHNLRTPLTSMMGYADLILNGAFGKQNKKTTEVITKFQGLVGGMIKMVNDFLDMAQFQLGKDVVSLKPGVEILPLLIEIENELKFKAESKGVYLKLHQPDFLPKINADREKLKAAIFNIIDNAVKYTMKGGVDVEVKNHTAVRIIVSDTGIGLPKNKIATLFETMFERTEEAKKVSTVGSGVGLYLSGQIIKFHHGKVWAESKGEGKGSVFYIELPLADAPVSPGEPKAGPQPAIKP